jgi:putative ABC transport system substrate-binding protein
MMRRREFIAGLGVAAASTLSARAQQSNVPVIGLLNGVSNEAYADRIASVRQGLREQGFVEGQNLAFEYRSAEGQYDRLPALAVDLVRRQVAVIVAIGSTNSPQAAKAATSTIPIVFAVGSDPVNTGLVTNIRRPEANLTGTTFTVTQMAPKLLEIAHELLPEGRSIGYLRNPTNAFDLDIADLTAAARALGCQLSVFDASTEQEIAAAFQSMGQQQIIALIVSGDSSLYTHRRQIVELAAHHAIATISHLASFPRAGGLIAYSVDIPVGYRWAGVYAGRILKGEKPADLPVQLPTKFGMTVNLKTAKALGLTVPQSILLRADEVIE